MASSPNWLEDGAEVKLTTNKRRDRTKQAARKAGVSGERARESVSQAARRRGSAAGNRHQDLRASSRYRTNRCRKMRERIRRTTSENFKVSVQQERITRPKCLEPRVNNGAGCTRDTQQQNVRNRKSENKMMTHGPGAKVERVCLSCPTPTPPPPPPTHPPRTMMQECRDERAKNIGIHGVVADAVSKNKHPGTAVCEPWSNYMLGSLTLPPLHRAQNGINYPEKTTARENWGMDPFCSGHNCCGCISHSNCGGSGLGVLDSMLDRESFQKQFDLRRTDHDLCRIIQLAKCQMHVCVWCLCVCACGI